MKYKIVIYGFILFLFIFSSCTKHIYFTQNLRNKIENKDLNLKEIQYYLSDKIILQRVMPIDEAKIARGEIKFENGNYIDQIIINKDTPGACESFAVNKIYISFEENNTLTFVRNSYSNFYELLVNKEIDNFNGVVYDSLIYKITAKGENAKLWIKKDEIYRQEVKQRVVKGKLVK